MIGADSKIAVAPSRWINTDQSHRSSEHWGELLNSIHIAHCSASSHPESSNRDIFIIKQTKLPQNAKESGAETGTA